MRRIPTSDMLMPVQSTALWTNTETAMKKPTDKVDRASASQSNRNDIQGMSISSANIGG